MATNETDWYTDDPLKEQPIPMYNRPSEKGVVLARIPHATKVKYLVAKGDFVKIEWQQPMKKRLTGYVKRLDLLSVERIYTPPQSLNLIFWPT